jgi:hypothetical protein
MKTRAAGWAVLAILCLGFNVGCSNDDAGATGTSVSDSGGDAPGDTGGDTGGVGEDADASDAQEDSGEEDQGSGNNGGLDAGADASPDTEDDVAPDVEEDQGEDVAEDIPTDVQEDTPEDVPADMMEDVTPDAMADAMPADMPVIETEVFLEFGEYNSEEQSLEIIMTNRTPVAGLQFQLDGVRARGGGRGGTAELAGMIVQTGGPCPGDDPCARVLAFSLNNTQIPAGRAVLTILDIDPGGPEVCFSDRWPIVVADENAESLTVSVGPCRALE